MISFTISFIDIILTLSVVVLGILYLRKTQERFSGSLSFNSMKNDVKLQDPSYNFRNILPESLNDYEELEDMDDGVSIFSDSF